MKRIEAAYKQYPSGIIYGGEGIGVEECRLDNFDCCPYFLGLGEDLEEETMIEKYGNIKGCRGITCFECWNEEIG